MAGPDFMTWLVLRIARLLSTAQKIRTHLVSQRSLQHLDIAFPDGDDDSADDSFDDSLAPKLRADSG